MGLKIGHRNSWVLWGKISGGVEGSEGGCYWVKTGGTGVESMLVAGVVFGGSEGFQGVFCGLKC